MKSRNGSIESHTFCQSPPSAGTASSARPTVRLVVPRGLAQNSTHLESGVHAAPSGPSPVVENTVRASNVRTSTSRIRSGRSTATKRPFGLHATCAPLPALGARTACGSPPGRTISTPPSSVTYASRLPDGDHAQSWVAPSTLVGLPPDAGTYASAPNATHCPSALNRTGPSAPVFTSSVCRHVGTSTTHTDPDSTQATDPSERKSGNPGDLHP